MNVDDQSLTSTPMDPSSIVTVATGDIMASCYPLESPILIISNGKFRESINELLPSSKAISTIRINDISFLERLNSSNVFFASIIIYFHSNDDFEFMLLAINKSIWWNYMSNFFILGISINSCKSAFEILQISWKMNMLGTIFVCLDSNKSTNLYTFNPYTNRAPKSWKIIKDERIKDNHWTLYQQYFTSGSNACGNIMFDRTKKLDGYEIRVTAMKKKNVKVKRLLLSAEAKDYQCMRSLMGAEILKSTMFVLNTTADMTFVAPLQNSDGYNMEAVEMLSTGKSDITFVTHVLSEPFNNSFLYSHYINTLSIITKRRGFLSPLEKIEKFYGLAGGITILFMTVVTTVFIAIYDKKGFISAVLEVIRISINTSLLSLPSRAIFKVVLSTIFLYFLIMQAIFQGNVSAFLTKPELRKNIDDMQMIEELNYKVYIPIHFQSIMKNQSIRYETIERFLGCHGQVINESRVACIDSIGPNALNAEINRLYMSEKIIIGPRLFYLTRNDWPLKNRVDNIHWRLAESGLTNLWHKNYTFTTHSIEKIRRYNEKATANRYRPIELTSLKFAFQMLSMGLFLSIFQFFFEATTDYRNAFLRNNNNPSKNL